MLAIVRELLMAHGVPPPGVFFFDMDALDCGDVLASPSSLVDFMGVPEKLTYVFIDEVQRLDNPGLFLKGVHDLGLPLKLIVSGSSSLGIRSKVRESLAGRKRVVRLGGLDWREYSSVPGTGRGLEDYLTFGGYPAVVLAEDPFEKRRLLLEYHQSYMDRDIDSFLRVDRLDVFRELTRILAFQSGSLVNLSEQASLLQVSRDMLKRYLALLEETFVVRRLLPFARNPRKEVSRMPKVYFSDCGWCNLAGAGFVPWVERPNRGPLLETSVEHWLRRRYPLAELRFWRSHSKAEVGFVVNDGGRILAFEVKAQLLRRPTISRSLRSFIDTHRPESATVVNLALNEQTKAGETPVRFVSFPECMEQ